MLEKRKYPRNKLDKKVKIVDAISGAEDTVRLKDYTIEGIAFTSRLIYEEHSLLKFSMDDKSFILYIIWGGIIKNKGIFEYGGRIFEVKE